jgi:hypothetical protein
VRALRDYYKGEHPIMLTKRQQEYLGALVEETEFTFAHNLVRSIVDTLRERLDVSGFTSTAKALTMLTMQDIARTISATCGAVLAMVESITHRRCADCAVSPCVA